MTTQEVAERLVELNKNHDYKTAYAELYTENVVSIENWGDRMEFKGIDAIEEKGKQWEESLEEIHEIRVSEPLVSEKSFAVTFYMDVTFKESSEMGSGRQKVTELAIYRVNDEGKISQEEFLP